jgi:hypothetical protein
MKTGDAKYGLHLNIHPAKKLKRVTFHALPCSHYRQQDELRKGIYSFNKNCASFSEAVDRASEWALEWHAPIKVCTDCLRSGRLQQ